MTSRRHATQPSSRISAGGWSLRALALLAVAFAAIASGCIYNYDPRDSSYVGPQQRDAFVLPAHIAV
jgi:hypothetical protein